MTRKMKVVCPAVTFGKFRTEPVNRLEIFGAEVILNPYGRPFTAKEFEDLAGDADAIIVGNDKVSEEVIKTLKRVKVIAKHGVGVDGIRIDVANKLGIKVTNAPGTNKEEVADSAMAFMLAMARDIEKMSRETKSGKWIKYPTYSMAEKTIGVIGVGNIGTAFVKRVAGFGMKILVYDPVQRDEVKKLGVEYSSFEHVISESDYLSIHCPLNQASNKMFKKKQFEMMKPNIFIVNTARSQIFDYDALYNALLNHRVGGYATDVFDSEPPKMHPLYSLENVLLTPHVAGTTYDSNYRMGMTAVENVIAVLSGKVPPDLVE